MKIKLNRQGFNVWFASDFHYSHKNIVKKLSNWDNLNTCRDFDSIEDMDNTIIKNLNDKIGMQDYLFILGDLSFSVSGVQEFVKRLNCKNLYLLYGNHDKPIRTNKHLQGHFRGISDVGMVIVDNQRIFMSHYAHRVWPHSHQLNTYHLYGHSHGNLPELDNQYSMDVGIDTNDFKPYSFDDIVEHMNQKKVV